MKKIKILFQGDSITDAGRNWDDFYNLGNGYPKYAAAILSEKYKNIEIEFINRGASGDETKDLVRRFERHFLKLKPDIVSILVGVNDVWHYSENKQWLPNDIFEEQYRTVLSKLKNETNAKIMMMEPFLIPNADKEFFREDLAPKIEIIRKLAREYADVYMPTDGLLASAFVGDDPTTYSADGVHPSVKGAEYIGKLYVEYVSKIIDKLFVPDEKI